MNLNKYNNYEAFLKHTRFPIKGRYCYYLVMIRPLQCLPKRFSWGLTAAFHLDLLPILCILYSVSSLFQNIHIFLHSLRALVSAKLA